MFLMTDVITATSFALSSTSSCWWSLWVGRSQLANRYHKIVMECIIDSSPGSTATRVHTTAGILFPVPSVS